MTHGTHYAYLKGCREDCCVLPERQRVRERKRARRAAGGHEPRHLYLARVRKVGRPPYVPPVVTDGPGCAHPDVDPEWFFSTDEFTHPEMDVRERDNLNKWRAKRARRICDACPLKAACLEQGLEEPAGVWGGLSSQERRVLTGKTGTRTTFPAVDPITVELAVAGHIHADRLNHYDRREAVLELTRRGRSKEEIARWLQMSTRVVDRDRESREELVVPLQHTVTQEEAVNVS